MPDPRELRRRTPRAKGCGGPRRRAAREIRRGSVPQESRGRRSRNRGRRTGGPRQSPRCVRTDSPAREGCRAAKQRRARRRCPAARAPPRDFPAPTVRSRGRPPSSRALRPPLRVRASRGNSPRGSGGESLRAKRAMSREVVALARLCIAVERVFRFRDRGLRVADPLAQIGRPLNVPRDVVKRQHLIDRVIQPRRDNAEPHERGHFEPRLERRTRSRGRPELDRRVFDVDGF